MLFCWVQSYSGPDGGFSESQTEAAKSADRNKLLQVRSWCRCSSYLLEAGSGEVRQLIFMVLTSKPPYLAFHQGGELMFVAYCFIFALCNQAPNLTETGRIHNVKALPSQGAAAAENCHHLLLWWAWWLHSHQVLCLAGLMGGRSRSAETGRFFLDQPACTNRSHSV